MATDSLESLREQVASLQVTRCRMVHERVRIQDGIVLRAARGGREPDLVRMGLCGPEVRGRNLACGHTMARYVLMDAVRALHAAGGLADGAYDPLVEALESIGNSIHLLDHQKGEAERRLALASERKGPAERTIAAEIKDLEEQHDAYASQMRELHASVLAHLDAAIHLGAPEPRPFPAC
jgi:hypothetical protein